MSAIEEQAGKIILGDDVHSLSDIANRAACAAQGMNDLGLGSGDVVALLLRNDFSFFEATFAANSLGAVVVPINWHASKDEVNYIIQDCGAKILIAHTDLYDKLWGNIPPDIELLLVSTPDEIKRAFNLTDTRTVTPEDVKIWDHWLTQFPPRQEAPLPSGGSMIYTSGTTGRPKGVKRPPLEEAKLLQAIGMACAMYGFQPDMPMTTLVTGPLYHSGPNGHSMLSARFGATIILQSRFNEAELLHLIKKHRVTHIHMVPTMFVRLLKLSNQQRQKYNLSSLQWVAHGAAPCPPKVKEKMIAWWGPVINEYYGSTETGGITVQTSKGAIEKPGSVGQAIEGIKLKIMNDDGQQLKAGEVGNIFIYNNFYGDFDYHGQAQERKDITQGEYVWIGDIGYLDEDDFLYLCDRRSDIINSGGINIYTAEIEAAILEISGITDCAVFGIPDEDLGEVVCAHITLASSTNILPGDITTFINKRLGRMKAPSTVVIATELPRQESGKIFKKKLRAPYWQNKKQNI